MLLRKKITKNALFLCFWICTSLISIFLITPYSNLIWENLSLIKAAGSHRLLLILTFSISVASGYFLIVFKAKRIFVLVLILVTILFTILNWGQRKVIPDTTNAVLKENLWKSTSQGEAHFYANTRWVNTSNPWFSKLPKSNIQIIEGEGLTNTIQKNSTRHSYIVNAKTTLIIKENTLYFPGWGGKINGKPIDLYPDKDGVINLKSPKGKNTIDIYYQDIAPYETVKLISLISIIGFGLYSVGHFISKK